MPSSNLRRILFVTCYYASDFETTVWGPFQRMSMLVEAACRVANDVDVLLFAAEDMVALNRREAIAASIERAWGVRVRVVLAPRVPASQGLRAGLRGLTDVRSHPDYGRAGGRKQADAVLAAIRDDTDLVVAQKLESALSVAACAGGGRPTVIDIDDVEQVSFERRIRQLPWSIDKALGLVRLPAVARGELDAIGAFTTGLVCSEADRRFLSARVPRTSIEVVPNAVRFPDEQPASRAPGGRTVVYFASYAYRPNVDAAEELIHRIFPAILERCPDARLLIAGAFAEKLPSFASVMPATTIVGFVKDAAEVYRQAAVACCPIRAGGGTRIKIIEASAWRIPTVSTALGAEGLDLDDGTEIVLAETSDGLALRCVELLESSTLAASIGLAAFRKARASYDRSAVIERIGAIYRAAAGSTSPGQRPTSGHGAR